MLDSVSPELRSWLIEKKPQTSGELATIANDHIQAKKGPIIDGKYVGYGKKNNSSHNQANCYSINRRAKHSTT